MTAGAPGGSLVEALAMLRSLRADILHLVQALDDECLEEPVPSSGLSGVQLLHHLTVSDAFWFRAVIEGDPTAVARFTGSGDEWMLDPEESVGSVRQRFRSSLDVPAAAVAGRSAEDPPAWWPPDRFGDWRLATVYQVVLHATMETAVYAGHLDGVSDVHLEEQHPQEHPRAI